MAAFKLLVTAVLLWSEPVFYQAPAEEPLDETAAQRIAHTQDALNQGRASLISLQKRLDDPKGEYPKAEADFQLFDKKVTQTKQAIAKLRADGKTDDATKLEADLTQLTMDWQQARDRFDLAIRERKAIQEAIAGLKVRIAKDQEQLDRLEGRAPSTPAPADTTAAATRPATHDTVPAVSVLPGMPSVAAPTAAPAPALSPATHPADEPKELKHARRLVEQRQAEQREAEAAAKTAKERVRAQEQSLKTMAKMLQIEQETTTQAEKSVGRLSETLRLRPPADPAEKTALIERLNDAQRRHNEARDRAQRIADRIATMNLELKELKEEQAQANKEVEDKRTATEAAESELAALLSPFTWANITKWIVHHGPNLLAILAGMIVLHIVTRQASRRIVRLTALNAHRGTVGERENRASTLIGVFRYAATMGIFGGGGLMLLDEAGVPVVPLMGGAAVFGLAAAFGAQNLIRDYFTGFMMLMEDQYSVNDVVRIGSVSGLVEKITLRMTVLRDLEGVRHFIPHGGVSSVSNMTHGWSRAMFDIAVSYSEDVDRVIQVLRELGHEMRADPELGHQIIEDPEMLGVQALADSRVTIRFLIKTRPLQQWPIRREMLRRIKKRFAELGIATPGAAAPPAVKGADSPVEPIPFPSLPDRAAG